MVGIIDPSIEARLAGMKARHEAALAAYDYMSFELLGPAGEAFLHAYDMAGDIRQAANHAQLARPDLEIDIQALDAVQFANELCLVLQDDAAPSFMDFLSALDARIVMRFQRAPCAWLSLVQGTLKQVEALSHHPAHFQTLVDSTLGSVPGLPRAWLTIAADVACAHYVLSHAAFAWQDRMSEPTQRFRDSWFIVHADEPVVLQVGAPGEAFLEAQGAEWAAIITAYNPGGYAINAIINEAADLILKDDLEQNSATFLRCTGMSADGAHLEPGYIILNADQGLLHDLQDRYKQASIVHIGRTESVLASAKSLPAPTWLPAP